MIKCNKCKLNKELKDYYKSSHKSHPLGYIKPCKECIKLKQKSSYTGEYHKTRLENLSSEEHQHRSNQLTINARERRKDPIVRLKEATRTRIYNALKGNKIKKTNEYLGCSIEIYQKHLENQFTPDMTWDNWGEYWEIDHKIPLSKGGSFHYLNTQPLIISENRVKSNKLI